MPTPIAELDLQKSPAVKPPPGKPKAQDAKAPPAAPEPQQVTDVHTVGLKDIKLRQHMNNDWRCKLPRKITLEQAQDPYYMAKALSVGSSRFVTFDAILCVAWDAAWAVELIVVDAGVGWVDFQLLRTYQFADRRDQGEARLPDGYSVHRDPHEGWWYGQRDHGEIILVDRCANREEAVRGVLDHAVFRNVG